MTLFYDPENHHFSNIFWKWLKYDSCSWKVHFEWFSKSVKNGQKWGSETSRSMPKSPCSCQKWKLNSHLLNCYSQKPKKTPFLDPFFHAKSEFCIFSMCSEWWCKSAIFFSENEKWPKNDPHLVRTR
jgi:hypothetical protein